MINEMLEAAEKVLVGDSDQERLAFIEEWVPKVTNRLSELEQQLTEARTLASMHEAELLEAQAKIKELSND